MTIGKVILGFAIGICSVLMSHCGINVAGGSSDTEVSAWICGTVKDASGNPVSGAIVKLRPTDYLPGSSDTTYGDTVLKLGNCYTNDSGYFRFDSVDAGNYSLDIRSSDTSGDTIGSIETVCFDTTVTITTTLLPLGVISGDVELPYVQPSIFEKTKVEVVGTDIITHADSSGHFMFSVPSGKHQIRISVDSSSFSEMVLNTPVYSSQYCNIGVLRPNFMPFAALDYASDSTNMRLFLDSAGYPDIPVEQVTEKAFGRISAINLRGIKISKPLSQLGMLNAVKKVDLGNTGTADSCRFVAGMWNLSELLLDSNAITGISRFFEGLHRLKVLDLSNNMLNRLPDNISNIHPEQELDLSGNKLCDIALYLQSWADRYDSDWRFNQHCE